MNFINRNEIANGVFFTNIKDSHFKTMKIKRKGTCVYENISIKLMSGIDIEQPKAIKTT